MYYSLPTKEWQKWTVIFDCNKVQKFLLLKRKKQQRYELIHNKERQEGLYGTNPIRKKKNLGSVLKKRAKIDFLCKNIFLKKHLTQVGKLDYYFMLCCWNVILLNAWSNFFLIICDNIFTESPLKSQKFSKVFKKIWKKWQKQQNYMSRLFKVRRTGVSEKTMTNFWLCFMIEEIFHYIQSNPIFLLKTSLGSILVPKGQVKAFYNSSSDVAKTHQIEKSLLLLRHEFLQNFVSQKRSSFTLKKQKLTFLKNE